MSNTRVYVCVFRSRGKSDANDVGLEIETNTFEERQILNNSEKWRKLSTFIISFLVETAT